MRSTLPWLATFSCFLSPLLGEDTPIEQTIIPSFQDIEAHLKNPTFIDGILETTQGGIIKAHNVAKGKSLRIQAQHIRYAQKYGTSPKSLYVVAAGNLLVEYGGRFFVADKLEYDFLSKTGTLYQGTTIEGIWFVGGETISLESDGTFHVHKAFITTSENKENTWDITAEEVSVKKNYLLSASNISLHLFQTPCLWMPTWKSNLSPFVDSPLRYKLSFDKGLWPKASLRYRFFSWDDLGLFFRLEYRLKEGPGAALESEYFSKDQRTTFITRSYGAYNKIVYDEHGLMRYRLQGQASHESKSKKTHLHLSYDKFSDLKMISDFPDNDFILSPEKRSRLVVNHQEDTAFTSLFIEPRLNTFDSINQKLPLMQMGVKPFPLAQTGIVSENTVSIGYLDYVYANDLQQTYPSLHERHAARVNAYSSLYRPIMLGPIVLTPKIGAIGIFYDNNPFHQTIGQGTLCYGGRAQSVWHKNLSLGKHAITPYLDYQGLTKPLATLSQHYAFGLEDGLYQINSMKIGLLNTIDLIPTFSPHVFLDVYTYAFFQDHTFSHTCPKGYMLLGWDMPSYLIQAYSCWNFEEHLLDFCNLLSQITVNEHLAFTAEYRHRSAFDWRKADHENFILDMARPIEELLHSPLSDKRNTILGKMQVRISPKWDLLLSSHYGFGRISEPSYRSFKIDANTLLTAHWQLRFSYLHTTNDDKFTMQAQLVK